MLTNLKPAGSQTAANEDAVTLLLGCHDRIRHFTGMAERLASNPKSPASERRQVASAVLRYYEIALPLHEADENQSIYPRLREVLPDGELAEANETMVRQHAEIDTLIAELIPLWHAIADDPAHQEHLSTGLRERVERLRQLWTDNLRLEEEQVVPAIRRFLSAADLESIEAEMRARRRSG